MALFVMADTHLSVGVDKPMDVFGSRWNGYIEKIRSRWCAVVRDEDTVVIPGDISWGLNLQEAAPDLAFLDSLPGTKLLGKGNHDFFWETASKMNRFFAENGFDSLHLLYNNAYRVGDFIVGGCRGWYAEGKQVIAQNEPDAEKIVARETGRLRLSLTEGRALQQQSPTKEGVTPELIAVMHFPPYFQDYLCKPLIDVLHEFGVRRCYYGHIHSSYSLPASETYEGIRFSLISADYLDFYPHPVFLTDFSLQEGGND